MASKSISKIAVVLLLLAFALSACTPKTCAPDIQIQYVKVPVYTVPQMEPIAKPRLPIEMLQSNATDAEVAEAYYNSVKVLKLYVHELEGAISQIYSQGNSTSDAR